MNAIDIIILVVLGVSIAYGLYKGFLHALLSLACGLLAFILAFTISPKLARQLSQSSGVSSSLATYTDAIARVGDYNLATAPVDALSNDTIDLILANVHLPDAIENILEQNLKNRAFQSNDPYAPSAVRTVNDYVSNTIVGVAVKILCFIVCYILFYLVLSLLVNLIHHVFELPLLKQMDWLAGGVLGLLRGAVILYVVFLALPLINTIISMEALDTLISESTLAPIFQSNGLFTRIIAKHF